MKLKRRRRRYRPHAVKFEPRDAWRGKAARIFRQAQRLTVELDKLLQEMPAQEARAAGVSKAYDDAKRTVDALKRAVRKLR